MTAINIVTLPEYYYLYALYFDYIINNHYFAGVADDRRVEQMIRVVQPLLGLRQPYRKTWALRLFTERQSLQHFRPEEVDEALRELRDMVDELGPPPRWPHGRVPKTPPARRRPTRLSRRSEAKPPPPTQPEPPFPRAPIDYDTTV